MVQTLKDNSHLYTKTPTRKRQQDEERAFTQTCVYIVNQETYAIGVQFHTHTTTSTKVA
jgi:hypothetical protein